MWLLLALQLAVVDVDKTPDLGPATHATPIETDGDPETRDWLVYEAGGMWAGYLRVVSLTAQGALCKGPRFYPWRSVEWVQGQIVRVGRVDRLVVQGLQRYREFALARVTHCEPF